MKTLYSRLSGLRRKAIYGVSLATLIATSLMSAKTAACPSNPLIGGMCAFGGNFSIRGWAFADGQILPISSYTAVFSLMGTTFGGDGRTTFGLPDLRGRAAIGVGNGPGLSTTSWGEKRGSEFVTLTVAQMPSHTHTANTTVSLTIDPSDVTVTSTLNAHQAVGTSTAPSANVLAQNNGSFVYSATAPDVAMASAAISASANATVSATATTTLGNSGGSSSHDNRMPYLTVNWLVALEGLYPSRS